MRGNASDYENATRIGPTQALLVLALIGVCATLGNGNDGLTPAQAWKAVSTSGMVESRGGRAEGPDWVTLSRGDLLEPNSLVHTLPGGEVTLSGRAGVLMVGPETKLRLPGRSPGDPPYAAQDTGTVVYEAGGGPDGPLDVATPALELSSRRAVFGVTVDGGWTLVSVEGGIVEIRPPGTDLGMDLHAGEAVRVRAEDGRLEMLERQQEHSAPDASPGARRVAWKQHQRVLRVVARLNEELREAEAEDTGLVSGGGTPRP